MKINERTLVALATSTSTPVDKEGWLWKRGEVNKSFQRRYFVLRGNLLFYFERKGDREPVGVVIMEGCTIELAEEEREKFAFKVVFHGDGKRTYILGAESQETMESWMKILSSSSYDYMKLMVLELQQQLAELEEAEKLTNNPAALVTPNGTEPSRPPRGRQSQASDQPAARINPFDQSPTSAAERRKRRPKKSWSVLHTEMGARITADRAKWCREWKKREAPLIDLAAA